MSINWSITISKAALSEKDADLVAGFSARAAFTK